MIDVRTDISSIDPKDLDQINKNADIFKLVYDELNPIKTFNIYDCSEDRYYILRNIDDCEISQKIIHRLEYDNGDMYLHEVYIGKNFIEIFNGTPINNLECTDACKEVNFLNTYYTRYDPTGKFCVYLMNEPNVICSPHHIYLFGYKASICTEIWTEGKPIEDIDLVSYESMYKFIYKILFNSYNEPLIKYDKYKLQQRCM